MLNRLENYLTDLRSVIGLFLFIVGSIVLLSYAFGPSDLVGGIHVNLLGGGCLALVGMIMIVARYISKKAD